MPILFSRGGAPASGRRSAQSPRAHKGKLILPLSGVRQPLGFSGVTSPRPPVLVLGSGLTVLGAIRLLGRAGFAPLVVSDRPGIAKKSRWYRAAPPSRATASPRADSPPGWKDFPSSARSSCPARTTGRCGSRSAPRKSPAASRRVSRVTIPWRRSSTRGASPASSTSSISPTLGPSRSMRGDGPAAPDARACVSQAARLGGVSPAFWRQGVSRDD